jgi:methyltransferase (TIGR00027 family)
MKTHPFSPASSEPIAHTALIVAAKRAIEQSHPHPLFHDPYAALLAQTEVDALLQRWQREADAQQVSLSQVTLKRTRYIAVRTRFFDDCLVSALAMFPYQVVILGAGLDTRAFRLTWPAGVSVYESDRPEVLDYKIRMLHDVPLQCQHHLIPADLADPHHPWRDRLLSEGFQPAVPTFWLLEGVVMYLTRAEADALLQRVTELSAANSILAMDGVRCGSIQAGQRAKQADRGRVIRHWQFGCDQPQDWLATHGWQAEVKQPGMINQGFGRYPQGLPVSQEVGGNSQARGVWLVRATRLRRELEC